MVDRAVNLVALSTHTNISKVYAVPIFSINRNTILNSECYQFKVN